MIIDCVPISIVKFFQITITLNYASFAHVKINENTLTLLLSLNQYIIMDSKDWPPPKSISFEQIF